MTYAVIGLGRFGAQMARRLFEYGEEVLAIDVDPVLTDAIADNVTRAAAADARDLQVLKRLGVSSCERAVVAVGSDLAASALITMNLKSLNVPYIVCKAHDDTYRDILIRLGADRVIIPEREVADRLARGLTSVGVMEYIDLSDEYGIVEIRAPLSWRGKKVRELGLRRDHSANIIALKGRQGININPGPEDTVEEDTTLVVLGPYAETEKLRNVK